MPKMNKSPAKSIFAYSRYFCQESFSDLNQHDGILMGNEVNRQDMYKLLLLTER